MDSDQTRNQPASSKVPAELVIVAIFFLLTAVWGAYRAFTKSSLGQLTIPFDLLMPFVSYGILHFRKGWRTCGLVFIWIGIVSYLYLLFWISAQVITGKISTATMPDYWSWVVFNLGICLIFLAASVWQFHILTRPDIKRLFGLEPQFSN